MAKKNNKKKKNLKDTSQEFDILKDMVESRIESYEGETKEEVKFEIVEEEVKKKPVSFKIKEYSVSYKGIRINNDNITLSSMNLLIEAGICTESDFEY